MADTQLHAMIDLETLDTETSAVVLSVGMVIYDPLTIDTNNLDSFYKLYMALALEPQVTAGRTISASTVTWWTQQSAEARGVFTEQPKMPPIYALGQIQEVLKEYKVENVWGNGADFDNAIINSLAKSMGYPVAPLNYKHNRCFRTVRAMFKHHIPEVATMPLGTHHHALDDAVYQAVQHGYIHRSLYL